MEFLGKLATKRKRPLKNKYCILIYTFLRLNLIVPTVCFLIIPYYILVIICFRSENVALQNYHVLSRRS